MKRGFTLIELVVYIAVVTITLLLVSQSVVEMGKLFRRARTERTIMLAAQTALERIAREIQLACSMVPINPQASLDSTIVLNTFKSYDDAGTQTCETATLEQRGISIDLNDSNQVFIDGDKPLIPTGIEVGGGFIQMVQTDPQPHAIRVELILTSGTITRKYNTMVTLRGSYK